MWVWQASPRVRFNKEGSLLAVTSTDNGIKILANEQGGRLLQHFEAARAADRSLQKVSPPPPPPPFSQPGSQE